MIHPLSTLPGYTAEEGTQWPKITVVTPSYNQGRYLEQTILSVISQEYPNLEYIVIDGGSSDNSVEILEQYDAHLDSWVSESDRGQYDAINKGFSRSSGDILAWLNSDDMYFPWTLQTIGEIFATLPETQWITSSYPMSCTQQGLPMSARVLQSDKKSFFSGGNFAGTGWEHSGWIQQESTFWRRTLWERTGSKMDEQLTLAGDFELWCRFYRETDLYLVDLPLALFRCQPEQKSNVSGAEYIAECHRVFKQHGGIVPSSLQRAEKKKLPRLRDILRTTGAGSENSPEKTVRYHLGKGWMVAE